MGNNVFSVKHIAKSFGAEGERNYIEVIKDISMDIEEKEDSIAKEWGVC